MSKRQQTVRMLISLLAGTYALALLVFLVLRLVVRDSIWWVAFLSDFTFWYFLPLIVLFPLALIMRAKRGILLMLPVLLIGIIWFGRYFVPKAVAQPSETTLRVITFNVWGANPQLANVEAWLREQDADVVLLQEVPPSWWRGGLQSLRNLYPYQLNRAAERDLWGHALLSKYPFQPAETMDYQRVLLDVNGETIAVLNIHMPLPMGDASHFPIDTQNGFLNMGLKYDPTSRNIVIQRLLTALDSETYPFIVGGDFNMSDQATMYGELELRMGDGFGEVGYGLGASWPIAEIAGLPSFVPPLVRIDYVWHSRDFQAVNAALGPHLNSDHLPLSVTLSRAAR